MLFLSFNAIHDDNGQIIVENVRIKKSYEVMRKKIREKIILWSHRDVFLHNEAFIKIKTEKIRIVLLSRGGNFYYFLKI